MVTCTLQLNAISHSKPDLERGSNCEACSQKAGTHRTELQTQQLLLHVNVYQIPDNLKGFQPASRGRPNLRIGWEFIYR